MRPSPDVLVVVAILDHRAEPADELAPAEPAPAVAAVAIPEPRRREHRRPVVVEDVDLMVVECDNDLELRVVVEVADADVLPVGAVAVVAGAVEVGVVALAGLRVEAGPRRRRSALRPVDGALRVEDEDLRSRRRGVGRRDGDLDAAVAVEIGGGHPSRLRALAAAARRRGPAGLQPQPPAAELVRRDGALVAADDDLRPLVAVEVGDHAGGVDPALRRRPLAEQATFRVVDERGVEGRDDLQLAVAVEVDEPGRREPARLAGSDRPDEARSRDGRGVRGGRAAGAGRGRVVGGVGAAVRRGCDRDHEESGETRQARHLGTLLAPQTAPAC